MSYVLQYPKCYSMKKREAQYSSQKLKRNLYIIIGDQKHYTAYNSDRLFCRRASRDQKKVEKGERRTGVMESGIK